MTVELIEEAPTARPRAGQKARFLVAASGLIVLAYAVDMMQAGGANWPALALRLGWAGLLLVNAAILVRARWGAIQVASVATSVGTALFYLALLGVTGRSHSPLFAFAFPLAMLLPPFMGELIRWAFLSSALLLLGAGAMLMVDGASVGEQVGWGHAGAIALMVAWLLGTSDLRARKAVRGLVQHREQDLLRLAESERLASVGRMAAKVAHEVNSPLAAAKANASYLHGQLAGADQELYAACTDLVETLDRIAALVRELGEEARRVRPEPPPRAG